MLDIMESQFTDYHCYKGYDEYNRKPIKPPHLLELEKSLNLNALFGQVKSLVPEFSLHERIEELPIAPLSKQQLRGVKGRIYNFSRMVKSKKWLKSILLDKNDSGDSDFETNARRSCDNDLKDMLRLYNLQKKVRQETKQNGFELSQHSNFSTSLLNPDGLLPTCNALGKEKKITKSNKSNKRKGSSVTSVSVVPINSNTVNFNNDVPSLISNVSNTCPEISRVASDILDTKRIKLESKMLDDIPYDTTLPDEILQSESSANISDLGPSCTPSLTDDIIYSSKLPDEIFDTEESSASMLSQCLSQSSKSQSVTSAVQMRSLTAPLTPSNSRPNSPQVIVTKNKKSGKKSSNHDVSFSVKRKRIWIAIARKEIPRSQKQKLSAHKEKLNNYKRMANWCQKERRRSTLFHQKQFCRDNLGKAKKLTKEMLAYWKHYEKMEKDFRKKAEKEAQEQIKLDIEMMEAKRQQRKLNFLITQTELYAHFMSKKLASDTEGAKSKEEILNQLDEGKQAFSIYDDYDLEAMKAKALSNVQYAIEHHQKVTSTFGQGADDLFIKDGTSEKDIPIPTMFEGVLKTYQLKGMSWLYYLYSNGINGILADEMGLGKTVQTIAFLSTLAEKHSIWGPFLIVAPASTLHNWHQELSRFTPKFKLLPYWGNPVDRKAARKFWNQKYLHRKEASFHILITSYQLVVQDFKFFQRIKWMYMILDEAQAIKSISSVRWKNLLSFQCRNRLLLSGTPIQNTMAELWALLHFIMPALFDSHEEFSEWFSKDIESHAENKTTIDEKHLSRLHMILKPFMLRRIKKDVENELSDKIEIMIHCKLTQRQKMLYGALKNKISIEELVQSSHSQSHNHIATNSLMNIVMQFRKVCNHPELFEKRDFKSPFFIKLAPFVFPDILFTEGLIADSFNFNPTRHKIIHNMLSVSSSDWMKEEKSESTCYLNSRILGMSFKEMQRIYLGGLVRLWESILYCRKYASKIIYQHLWNEENTFNSLLVPTKTTYFESSFAKDSIWESLLFTWNWKDHNIYCFTKHNFYQRSDVSKTMRQPSINNILGDEINNRELKLRFQNSFCLTHSLDCEATVMPKFLFVPMIGALNGLKVGALPREVICYKQRCAKWQAMLSLGGSPKIFKLLTRGDTLESKKPVGGILSINCNSWSLISIPDKETLVSDSGKMILLDDILKRLKDEGHRVLIYSQMTRMIDLLEEYMLYREFKYLRLDGSSRINDRRDMVADFQNRSDIFIFLLSTRAGGLGINLTAADTVIFYDSDWNPTVDQQAMDRAHRLGQTKQVTVYRLICKETIEERILERAKEKSEIQRMVISGESRGVEMKANEMVSLLLDDQDFISRLTRRKKEKDFNKGGKNIRTSCWKKKKIKSNI